MRETLREAGVNFSYDLTDEEVKERKNTQLRESVIVIAIVSTIIAITVFLLLFLHRKDIIFANGKKHRPWMAGLLVGVGFQFIASYHSYASFFYILKIAGTLICILFCGLSFFQPQSKKKDSSVNAIHLSTALYSVLFFDLFFELFEELSFGGAPYFYLLPLILLVIAETGTVKKYKGVSPFDASELFADSSAIYFSLMFLLMSLYCAIIIMSHEESGGILGGVSRTLLSFSPFVNIIWLGLASVLLIIGITIDIAFWKLWALPRTIARLIVYTLLICIGAIIITFVAIVGLYVLFLIIIVGGGAAMAGSGGGSIDRYDTDKSAKLDYNRTFIDFYGNRRVMGEPFYDGSGRLIQPSENYVDRDGNYVTYDPDSYVRDWEN